MIFGNKFRGYMFEIMLQDKMELLSLWSYIENRFIYLFVLWLFI